MGIPSIEEARPRGHPTSTPPVFLGSVAGRGRAPRCPETASARYDPWAAAAVPPRSTEHPALEGSWGDDARTRRAAHTFID